MLTLRKSSERGFFDHGWLKTYHTFSFADYRDPHHTRFRALRVINEDWVAPSHGFDEHPHRDMEIITYVLSGQLEHRDSMGNGEILYAGEMQQMTAGSGITHSEFNSSPDSPVHLYQIWLFPERKGIEPAYQQKRFDPAQRQNRWQLVVSPSGEGGSLTIHQDARIYLGQLDPGSQLSHQWEPTRHGWLQVIRGSVRAGEQILSAGDALAISDEPSLRIDADQPSEVMLFDLA